MKNKRYFLLRIKDCLKFMEDIISSPHYQAGMGRRELEQFVTAIANLLTDKNEELK